MAFAQDSVEIVYQLGVATLERRSKAQGIGGAGPDRCGIASSDQNPLTDRWLGVDGPFYLPAQVF